MLLYQLCKFLTLFPLKLIWYKFLIFLAYLHHNWYKRKYRLPSSSTCIYLLNAPSFWGQKMGKKMEFWSINCIQYMPFSDLARGNEHYRNLITILLKMASLNIGAITKNTHTLSVNEFGQRILPTASKIPRTSIIIKTKTCMSCFLQALISYFLNLNTTLNSDQLNTQYVKFMCCVSIDITVYQTSKNRV